MYCTYCGAALPDGARYCAACGKLLGPSSGAGAGAPTPPAQVRPAEGPTGESGSVLRSNVDEFEATAAPRYAPLLDEVPLPTVSGSYEHGWRQLKRFFWPLFVAGLVYVLVQVPLSLVDLALEEQVALRVIVQLVTGLFVSTPLGLGLAYAFLRAARGETPEVGDLFVPYRRAFWPSIASSVLYGLCVLVGVVLLIVPGIIIAIRLGFYTFLVVDEGYGPSAALQESWERTRGYGWTVLGVSLLAIPIVILGLVALIVGVIPAVMLVQLAEASLFVAISARLPRLAA